MSSDSEGFTFEHAKAVAHWVYSNAVIESVCTERR